MPFTRSNNKAVAAVQQLAVDFVDKMLELACYLKGLVTSQASNWMERIREWQWARWILEKARELYQRLAWSVGCKMSSLAHSIELRAASAAARDSVLRAVWKARNLIRDLHGDYLYGNDLQHAEKLHDVLVVLEDAEAKLMELQRFGEGKDNEDAPASKKMRFE